MRDGRAILLREQSAAKFIGRLGWEDLRLPELLVWAHLTAALAVTILDARGPSERGLIPWRDRLVLVSLVAAGVMLVTTLVYLQWNTVGNPAVRGVQRGRYFLPLAPVGFLCLQGIAHMPATRRVLLLGMSAVWAIWVVERVWERYFGF